MMSFLIMRMMIVVLQEVLCSFPPSCEGSDGSGSTGYRSFLSVSEQKLSINSSEACHFMREMTDRLNPRFQGLPAREQRGKTSSILPKNHKKNLKSQFPHFLYFMTFEFSRQKYNLILAQKFNPQKTFEFSRPKNNLILCSFSAKIQILHFTTFAKC